MKKLIVVFFLVIGFTSFGQRENSSLKVGDIAPTFVAKDQNGNLVNSKDLLANNQVIVIFYRGEWCSYCNKHLSHLQDHVDKFKKAGAILVAISPELPDGIDKTVEKSSAKYPILHDKDSKIMKAYGVDVSLR